MALDDLIWLELEQGFGPSWALKVSRRGRAIAHLRWNTPGDYVRLYSVLAPSAGEVVLFRADPAMPDFEHQLRRLINPTMPLVTLAQVVSSGDARGVVQVGTIKLEVAAIGDAGGATATQLGLGLGIHVAQFGDADHMLDKLRESSSPFVPRVVVALGDDDELSALGRRTPPPGTSIVIPPPASMPHETSRLVKNLAGGALPNLAGGGHAAARVTFHEVGKIGLISVEPGAAGDAEPSKRRVDLALRRDDQAVARDAALAAAERYQLRVQIGARLEGGLLDDAPSLDDIVPPSPGGRLLDVSVFGADFEIIGERTQPLLLPRTGTSVPVDFELRTPARPGRARLQVVVSYLDHVLQVFAVSAEVAAPGAPVRAELVFSTTRRFDNLMERRPRSAFIVNGAGDVPALAAKCGARAVEISLASGGLANASGRFRDTLAQAVGTGLEFPEPVPAGTEVARRTRCAAVIRALATLGAELWNELRDATNRAGHELLDELRDASGLSLMMVEARHGDAFPWAIVYDGKRPAPVADMAAWPVCLGFDAAGAPCGHAYADTDRLICARRMWGVRHQIEWRFAPTRTTWDDCEALTRVGGAGAPLLGVGVGERAAPSVATGALPALLDELADASARRWSGSAYPELRNGHRAQIVAVLGHLAMPPVIVEPAIDLQPDRFYRSRLRNDAIDHGDWTAPHSIVLLLACSSNAQPAGALGNLTDTLFSLGAGAVIGTETTVYADLCACYLAHVVRALRQPTASLGDALTEARVAMLRGLNPIGFTFIGWGNADLRLGEAT